MKFLHIADLHIGRRLGETSLLDEQAFIIEKIIDTVRTEKPDGILIAGDVYDRSLPTGDAVLLLDQFLSQLESLGISVFLISGNHDSPERLHFGSSIMKKRGVHISGTFSGMIPKVTLSDEWGRLNIFLLPFLKPAVVRPFFGDSIQTHDDAVRAAISASDIDPSERNILVAHQFVTSGFLEPECTESEILYVGGLDRVDASCFDLFDYVALGHLHRAQKIGKETVRYAGSPLKYSFSEASNSKSISVVEFSAKGNIETRSIGLIPNRDMRRIRGPLAALLKAARENPGFTEDYIEATLTDEEVLYDPIGELRQVYPNILEIKFENRRTRESSDMKTCASGDVAKKSPMELFSEFYLNQNNIELNPEQTAILRDVFELTGGEPV